MSVNKKLVDRCVLCDTISVSLITLSVDLGFICVIIKKLIKRRNTYSRSNLLHEKTYQDALESCGQALAGIPRKNGNKRRQENIKSSSSKRQKNALHQLVVNILVAAISGYQHCRSLLPRCCRFWPSCSEYAKEALLKYGIIKGGYKALARIMRCHPYSGKSGFDPLL